MTHLQRTSSWWGRPQPPHVFAIVNPISGRGKSRRVAQEHVLPLLRDVAGLRVTAHVTKVGSGRRLGMSRFDLQ